jgi:putative FmdB family regulatory protein
MPTYEFACPNGHHFDKFFRRISSAVSELPCPQCGLAAERQISGGAGLLFKGSGFYITDYGKDGKKGMSPPSPTSGGDGASSPATSSGTSASTESKTSSASGSESKSLGADSGTKSK